MASPAPRAAQGAWPSPARGAPCAASRKRAGFLGGSGPPLRGSPRARRRTAPSSPRAFPCPGTGTRGATASDQDPPAYRSASVGTVAPKPPSARRRASPRRRRRRRRRRRSNSLCSDREPLADHPVLRDLKPGTPARLSAPTISSADRAGIAPRRLRRRLSSSVPQAPALGVHASPPLVARPRLRWGRCVDRRTARVSGGRGASTRRGDRATTGSFRSDGPDCATLGSSRLRRSPWRRHARRARSRTRAPPARSRARNSPRTRG